MTYIQQTAQTVRGGPAKHKGFLYDLENETRRGATGFGSDNNWQELRREISPTIRPRNCPRRSAPNALAFSNYTTPPVMRWLRRTASMRLRSIRDKAVAMQAYAKQANNTTLITQATEIRMRAERRAGELLIDMGQRKQREAKGGDRKSKSQVATLIPKLSDFGINKTQSSRWQPLAALDADTFEVKVEGASKRAYDGITQRFLKQADIARAKQQHGKIIEHGCTVDDLIGLAESGTRFPIIYADPAWPWNTFSRRGRIRSCADHHYGLSTIDEIKALPVARLAADDCVLLIWGTWPRLPDVLDVIAAWGFTYKTVGFVWVKQNARPYGSTPAWVTTRARTANTV